MLGLAIVLALAGCERQPSETELVASANELLAKREVSGAVLQLKGALAQNPGSAEARMLLGKCLLLLGDPVSALVELRKAQEAQAPIDKLLPELARALLAAGDAALLIDQYAGSTLPNAQAAADLKATVATAYAGRGQPDKAREAAAAALQLQPGYAAAIVLLARLDAAAGDTAGAHRRLEEVLAREPGNERAALLKGEILLATPDGRDAALTAFQQVRVANPGSVAAHLAIINILQQQGKANDARATFQELRKLAPRHPDTVLLQARFAYDDKDYKTSREVAERLLAVRPNDARLLLLVAGAEFQMAQYTLAQALLGRALNAAPDSPFCAPNARADLPAPGPAGQGPRGSAAAARRRQARRRQPGLGR